MFDAVRIFSYLQISRVVQDKADLAISCSKMVDWNWGGNFGMGDDDDENENEGYQRVRLIVSSY